MTTLGSNVTDGGNDDTTPTEDGGDATSDDVQSDSEIFGMGTVTVGIIAGAILLLLLSLVLVVRGRGESTGEDKLFQQQQMAYASITGLPRCTTRVLRRNNLPMSSNYSLPDTLLIMLGRMQTNTSARG